MDLNIRPVAVSDIMPLVAILNKLDLKEILTAVDASKLAMQLLAKDLPEDERKKISNDDNAMLAVIIDKFIPVIGLVLNNIPACEAPLYKWLASMCQVSEKEFRAMPPAALPEALYEIIHQEGFGDFFKAASKFLK